MPSFPTCESCKKESEHIIPCATCGKKVCHSCAHHFKSQYLCTECLKDVYTHPVRKEEDIPVPKEEEKPAGVAPVKLPIIQVAALIIILLFFLIGWTYMASLPPQNVTVENETDEPPLLIITTNDTLNAFPHMRSYLQVVNYSIICDAGAITGLEISLDTGSMPLALSSVELFEKNIVGDFSVRELPSHTTTTTRLTNLQSHARINRYNTTTLELIFIANRGVYQKAILTPNPNLCQD